MELSQLEQASSFNAVRSFLQTPDLFYGCFLQVQIIADSELGRHPMNDNLEISFYERDAIYTFYSNCFYSYTKTDKLKSSEYLFCWDDGKKELFTFHDKIKIIIKRN